MTTTKEKLTAEQILRISETAPEKLFSGNPATAKSEFHALSRFWHPDHNSDADAVRVFQHITLLYRKAQEFIKNDAWRGAGVFEIETIRGGVSSTRRIGYFRKVEFELGDMFVGDTEIVFSVKREFADLFDNAKKRIGEFRFANPAMQKEISRNLPQNPEYFATAERLILILPKTPDLILLEDLHDYFGGKIDPQHVCWIQSGLHNLACYFRFAGVVHQDISLRTYFVSPKNHHGQLLGGWWYARRAGEKISALPARTIRNAPADVMREKRADGRMDLELIRTTGRELLGDAAGTTFAANSEIPTALARWFNGATSGDAVTDYELWRNAVQMSYGKPRFVKMDVDANEIYK